MEERFNEFLKRNGYVPTYVRSKMLFAIMEMESDFSIKEMEQKMRKNKTPISNKTAHFNIKIMNLFGIVEKVAIKDPVDGLVWRYRKRELEIQNA